MINQLSSTKPFTRPRAQGSPDLRAVSELDPPVAALLRDVDREIHSNEMQKFDFAHSFETNPAVSQRYLLCPRLADDDVARPETAVVEVECRRVHSQLLAAAQQVKKRSVTGTHGQPARAT